MYTISKEFSFDYSHRVWSQKLNNELSCNANCKCRYLHGHTAKVLVYLSGEDVDERGMFLDFNELQFFKKFIDDVVDHKMIMDIQDPLFPSLTADIPEQNNVKFLITKDQDYMVINPVLYEKLPLELQELAQSFVLVNFVPTSENLAKWLHTIVQDKLKQFNVKVSRVQFFETPKSQSNYIA